MNEMEMWIDIEGYEGLYQVSDLGRVRSLGRKVVVKQERYSMPRTMNWKPRVLRQGVGMKGYCCVVLRKDGVGINHRVHRLVAAALIPNPDSKPAINHKNSDRLDNSVGNLEWCTIAENNAHANRNGRRSKRRLYTSYFNAADRLALNELFDAGIGVTAIATQLDHPYSRVRYVYRLYKLSQNLA